MWEPRLLRTLWAFIAYYRYSLLLLIIFFMLEFWGLPDSSVYISCIAKQVEMAHVSSQLLLYSFIFVCDRRQY
jgi:hypothetical protein